MPTTIFMLENDGETDLCLFLEPEGAEFRLKPKKSVELHIFGSMKPLVLQQSIDEEGRSCVSLWPDQGKYEVFFEGKDIWSILLKQ
jgi:hypothetical protein